MFSWMAQGFCPRSHHQNVKSTRESTTCWADAVSIVDTWKHHTRGCKTLKMSIRLTDDKFSTLSLSYWLKWSVMINSLKEGRGVCCCFCIQSSQPDWINNEDGRKWQLSFHGRFSLCKMAPRHGVTLWKCWKKSSYWYWQLETLMVHKHRAH